MWLGKREILLSILCIQTLAATSKSTEKSKPAPQLSDLEQRVTNIEEGANRTTNFCNRALSYVCAINQRSIEATKTSSDAFKLAEQTKDLLQNISVSLGNTEQRAQNVAQQVNMSLTQATNTISTIAAEAAQRVSETARKERELNVQDQIKIEQTKIQSGIYQQAAIASQQEQWKHIKGIFNDTNLLIKLGLAIGITSLGIYAAKYGIPELIASYKRPHVIKECNKQHWFSWKAPPPIAFDDLIFTPQLHNRLATLLSYIQTATLYDEQLPNVLFSGPSGSGKTASAKAIAYASQKNYIITSGTEFAKLDTLAQAIDEFDNLLAYAKRIGQGTIVVIDEAELLFADRNFHGTPYATQHFINAFLARINEQSQYNIMFIFATNHPFKIDPAILNRIGIIIDFNQPTNTEREQILRMYLAKQNTKTKAFVQIDKKVWQSLSSYAEQLECFSPRELKFIAEQMLGKARRTSSKTLTLEITQATVNDARYRFEHIAAWSKERTMLAKTQQNLGIPL